LPNAEELVFGSLFRLTGGEFHWATLMTVCQMTSLVMSEGQGQHARGEKTGRAVLDRRRDGPSVSPSVSRNHPEMCGGGASLRTHADTLRQMRYGAVSGEPPPTR
jgi:hypothetical protein